MPVIYKYQISPNQESVVMPKGAQLLSVHNQNEQVCVWALVNTDAPPENRHLRVYGTGIQVPSETAVHLEFVGTAMLMGGALVLHVFEYIPPKT